MAPVGPRKPAERGERFDDQSGLQYLNARYYDPKLAMFIQPDWWEVMQHGVGTNRYSYSFNDPVNGKDPSGNDIDDDPRDKSLDSGEYDTARGQEGQSVDEAWARGENDAAVEAAAKELFGKSYGELNGIEKAAATVLGAAKAGLLGPGAHMVANSDPTDPAVPQRAAGLEQALRTLGQKAADTVGLTDNDLVCRGGTCTAEQFRNGSGVTSNTDGTLNGISTQARPGATLDELAQPNQNNQVGVTTVGKVRAAGGTVTLDGSAGNPNHATVGGISAETAERLFNPTEPNPVPKHLRGR